MAEKRVPLTGAPNTRPGVVSYSTNTAVAGRAIVGRSVVGSSGTGSTKDHRLINCFQETVPDPIAQSQRIYVVKRQGFATHSTPASGNIGNAIRVWTGQGSGTKVMSAFGAANSTLYDETTSKGAITGKARDIEQADVSGTSTLLLSSSDSTGWLYQDGGSVTQISDSDFPGNAGRTTVGNFAALDGYVFIMDSAGRVYNGDLNSVTAWTANSFFSTNSVPDMGVGVFRHRDTLLAFSRESMEVLYNAGNPTNSPLSRINERTQQIGLASADAVARLRDTLYFAGTTKANVGIYSYDGGQLGKISTPEIDAVLAYAGPQNIVLTVVGFYGRHFVVVCASTLTRAYCVEEKAWSEWSGTQLWHKADGVSTGATMVNYAISRTSTAGKAFVLSALSPTYQDNGSTLTATIQTTKLDFGTNKKKTFKAISVIGDKETTASSGTLSWSDDDYVNTRGNRSIDLSADQRTTYNCGRARRRSFTWTHAVNGPMRLEALDVEYTVDET
jgi:hypothetical protein